MYERLLDKLSKPTPEQFTRYCGSCKELFLKADEYLTQTLSAEKLLRFPYGNNYGWGYKYFKKSKLICDVFAEKDAFNVMLRLANTQYDAAYSAVSSYTKEFIDNKYPCGSGGYIHYRVLNEDNLEDIKLLLNLKVNNK